MQKCVFCALFWRKLGKKAGKVELFLRNSEKSINFAGDLKSQYILRYMKKIFFCVMGLLVAGAVMVNGAGLMELSSGNVLVDTCKTVTSAPAHILAYDLTADSTATGYDFSFKANMAANSAALVFFNEAGDSIGTIAIPSGSRCQRRDSAD